MRICIAVIAAVALAVPALASPQSDFDAVYGDWKADGVISQCRWTQAQLQNAQDVANGNPDFQYETGFQDNVQTEIDRWKAGGCSGVLAKAVKSASPLTGARITAVKGSGAAAKETLKIRNGAKKTLSFRKARVRNAKGRKLVFPSKFKLAKGKTAVVHIGCAKGKRHASYKKTTVWLCSRKQVFRDKGDVAKLADAKGVVVSQRGFGNKKRVTAF